MGDGSGDTQRVWHEHVGRMFEGVTILDAGAGHGRSKSRLANGRNAVTTQDINRALLDNVDIVVELGDMKGQWDVVTAFDVVEHAVYPNRFLRQIRSLARCGVFVTTPNAWLYPRRWHYYPEGFRDLICAWSTGSERWYLRYHHGEEDYVEEVSLERFLATKDAYALGVYQELSK